MSNDDPTEVNKLYIRFRGRVQGPFDREQLKTMATRGQLTRLHEVSPDGQAWQRASVHPDLFAVARPTEPASDEDTYAVEGESASPAPTSQSTMPSPSSAVWHYTSGPEQHGPVDFPQLRFLISAGQVTRDDLVWKEGMPDWTPVDQVPGLIPRQRPSESQSYATRRSDFDGPPRVSGLAVASLVLGILWLAGLGSLLAIIFGAVAIYHIRYSQGLVIGRGMAIAGLTLGIVFLSIQIALWIAALQAGGMPASDL